MTKRKKDALKGFRSLGASQSGRAPDDDSLADEFSDDLEMTFDPSTSDWFYRAFESEDDRDPFDAENDELVLGLMLGIRVGWFLARINSATAH